jgi:uncharacterized protein involved in exopolysaccharide biosynthesis
MTDDTSPEQLRQELTELDAQIAQLRGDTDQVTASIGPDHGDGVQNSEDIAAELTGVEEDEGVIEILEQRRESIRAKLADHGGS